METIALFGGSFDPPHIGHKAIVEALRKLDFIDKIVVMPTFLNPFKSHSYASSKQRLLWLQDIFSEFDDVYIDDFEVKKSRKVSTIESVRHLLQNYSRVYVVVGADNLASLHKWSNYKELSALVTFIVAPRDGIEVGSEFITLEIDEKISSSELRKKMQISKIPKVCALEIENFYKETNEY